MRHFLITFVLVIGFQFQLLAQKTDWVYATMTHKTANDLRDLHPRLVDILKTENNMSVVHFHLNQINTVESSSLNGPGFILHSNKEAAVKSLFKNPAFENKILEFSITENDFIQTCLPLVDPIKIGETILTLENYGTRFHTKPSGIQASVDMKNTWQNMAQNANRSDVQVEFFSHDFSQQKSIIITIPGSQNPEEIVVLGAHIDCGDSWNPNNAPGADDNASGVATITEVYRVLLESNFRPKKTVQIMAFAAEEVGLLGANDIAGNYSALGKNVLGMLNLDMVNYKGSSDDIFIVSDPGYTTSELNLFLIELLEYYHSSGPYPLTYQQSECGYACSDHAAWSDNGFMAAYAFEAAEGEENPFYHSPGDTYANMGNDASHAAKFARLSLEFLVEIAKTTEMNTSEVKATQFSYVVQGDHAVYAMKTNATKILSMEIVDTSAIKVISKENLPLSGTIDLAHLPKGVYIVVFKLNNGEILTKKFLK
jgi:leucyl aminopeptidase